MCERCESRRPSWSEYFMTNAKLAAMRSQDPSTKVGCAIVKDNKLVSIGYNGFPSGLDFTWEKNGGLDSKYWYIVHAEANALINAENLSNLKGATVYVTLFPCNECAKLLVQAGIKKVVYASDKYWDQDSFKASRQILTAAGIDLEEYSERDFEISEIH